MTRSKRLEQLEERVSALEADISNCIKLVYVKPDYSIPAFRKQPQTESKEFNIVVNPAKSVYLNEKISRDELERAVSAFLREAKVCSEVHGLGVSSHIENPYEALGKALATLGITVEE